MTSSEKQILSSLKKLGRPEALAGMARYAIDTENAYGVAVPELRRLAKEIGRDHALARALWRSGVHDARLLATMIAVPAETDRALADAWAGDFRSWDLCDQCCSNLLRKCAFAHDLVGQWRRSEEEFVKRAAFAMIAVLAVHDKRAGDDVFTAWLPFIEEGATDARNYVKKAVNWALRQIGKRNRELNREAIECARRIGEMDSKPARWIASDALRELTGETVQNRLK
ncbi:MAG: DNA alkylation repair protein [Alphaproteobacteria bacterium]|jgi:3-methyladenine DNA glycosylase AlkD|nr:DNA alkylation repair protein [Alphaproteobacteria bacterium]MDP6591381.1 DNA alkylation repair protein [Alphaproteobacteria bacterium]MDP6819370.1 DNA alkylation repair protein [Alphaproteobacteria bacterium]